MVTGLTCFIFLFINRDIKDRTRELYHEANFFHKSCKMPKIPEKNSLISENDTQILFQIEGVCESIIGEIDLLFCRFLNYGTK